MGDKPALLPLKYVDNQTSCSLKECTRTFEGKAVAPAVAKFTPLRGVASFFI